MPCGCGGSNSGAVAGGPLLSGTLSGGPDAGAAPDNSGIAAADVGGTPEAQFRSGGFWFLLVVFVIGGAWYLDSRKKGQE